MVGSCYMFLSVEWFFKDAVAFVVDVFASRRLHVSCECDVANKWWMSVSWKIRTSQIFVYTTSNNIISLFIVSSLLAIISIY